MTPSDDTRMWIVAGSLGSMTLGVALIPLRSLTAASNLAFVFLAFTIIVAEFGGRTAALATAVMAAISLNFFLTEPYLTLTISEKLDAGMPPEELLGHLKERFGLSAIVLRDDGERILAAAPSGLMTAMIPGTLLAPDSLLPSDDSRLRFGPRGLRLPASGGRLSVRSRGGVVSFDLWEGGTQGFGVLEARALTIAAFIVAQALSGRRGP